ncbi:unnamed protein product [Paramecium pentaurelia]|uniref:Peptidase M14 domain-containing protein n=1 Tax=Paramecium pentaurelia TaxID=43138 RepID=A0A8S1WJ56_9CILI|nr:unnamed protein product [Paramecium pentaurelia]
MLNQDVDLNIQPFLNQIPKAITLTDHSFSLENDMLLGWAPKVDYSKLLTLNFANHLNDSIIAKALHNNQLLYLGFRPQDTGQMHKQYSNGSSYPFKQIKILQRKPQLPFLGMNPNLSSRILFNSTFESGNLDIVVKCSDTEYDLYMRVDGNTKGHTLWYNFEMTGMKKTEVIQLNICNFRKSRTLYERGMKPYIWRSTNPEWLQGGEQIQYKTHYNSHYNSLSFKLVCNGDNEVIKVAYCVPYTYTQMLEFCWNMQKNCNHVEKTVFCESLSGVQLPLYTFSYGNNYQNQKCMIIQARIHPGESNGSWVMQGLLEFLSSQQGLKLIKKCVIKVVPMMNPDGVILGNYRTGIAGKDLNRRFKLTDQMLFPTVWAMKRLVKEQHSIFGNNLIGFIDLHGHSVKKNVFLYGPEYPLWNYNYYKCRVLAKLLGQKTEMFRYYSSIFRISQSKKSTARGVFLDLYDIVNCFTIESSNGSYYNQTQTFEFTCKHWIQMGWIIGETLTELVEMQSEMDMIYNQKNDETKRSNRQIKNQMFNKKRSFTGYQEDQCYQQFQNTKFANLFDELKQDADKMNISVSEKESDSSDDDGSETYLEDIKQQILQEDFSKSKYKDKPMISIMQPISKSKIEQRFSPRIQQQQSSQQSIMLSIQKSEKKFNNPSRSVQNSIIKKVSSNSQSKKSTKITNYITNYPNGQNSATLVFQEDYNLNQFQPSQQLMHTTLQRPSTANLEVTEEDIPFPIQSFNTSNYNVFKQHTRLRSNITINKQIKDQKKLQSKSHQTTPPLLQQMGINVKSKLNTQTNLEQLGLKIKPQHFLAPKKSEEPIITDLSKNINSIIENQKSTRPPKPNVPPSFYSVKRHMMLRLKN